MNENPKKLANPVVRELDSTRFSYILPTEEKSLLPELLEFGTRIGNRHMRCGCYKFRCPGAFPFKGEPECIQTAPAWLYSNDTPFFSLPYHNGLLFARGRGFPVL